MPLEDVFQWINNQFGWGTYIPPTLPQNKNSAIIDKVHFNNDYQPVRSVGKLKDLKELWDELTAIIPTDELLTWYLEMLVVKTCPLCTNINGREVEPFLALFYNISQ